jgi:type I restriction enzyme S subunit
LRKCTLSELNCKLISGFAFKSQDYSDSGVPLIKIGNIQEGIIRTSKSVNKVPDAFVNSKMQKFLLQDGDVLIAMTGQGSVGRVGRLYLNDGERALLNQRVGKFSCDEVNLNVDFLYYILTTSECQDALFASASGSGQPNLSPETILAVKIPRIDYRTQIAIGKILKSIDDKIELNNKTNHDLETLAQTLFKHWFVDFNFPNEAGRPYRSSGGEMMDSKIGIIPKGWSTQIIKNLGRVVTGKTPSNKDPNFFGDKLPFITPTDFKNYLKLVVDATRGLSLEGREHFKKNVLPVNSLLVTCIGSAMGKVAVNKVECATNQQINSIVFNANSNVTCEFSYYFLNHRYDDLRNMATGGSTMPIVNKSDFERIQMLVPDPIIAERFTTTIQSIDAQVEANLKEYSHLLSLKETILPMLISGELEIS